MCSNTSANDVREEIYTEKNCPPDGSQLSVFIEEYFNEGELVEDSICSNCSTKGLAEKRTLLENVGKL